MGGNHERRPWHILGLRPLDGWDCGFEYLGGHGCLYLLSTLRLSLVLRSPIRCGVSVLSNILQCGGLGPLRLSSIDKKNSYRKRSNTKTNQLLLYEETVTLYTNNHIKFINTLCKE